MTKYWYFQTWYECPQCMGQKVYRERRYTPRPKDWLDRNEIIEAWDYCDW